MLIGLAMTPPRLVRIGCLFSLFLLGCVSAVSLAGDTLTLAGSGRWMRGDAPQWAAPERVDADWATAPADLPAPSFLEPSRYVWRLRFCLADARAWREPALALGRLGQADEVFLNGTRIGGTGRIEDARIEATWVERLYLVPPGLLRADNLLAVRLRVAHGRPPAPEPPRLGDWSTLALERAAREAPRRISELLVLNGALVAGLFLLAVRPDGRARRLTAVTVAANLLFLIVYFTDSLLFLDWYPAHQGLARLGNLALALFPAVLLEWVRLMLGRPAAPWRGALALGFAALALGFAVEDDFVLHQWLVIGWITLSSAVLLVIALDLGRAWQAHRRALAPLAALLLMVIASALVYLLGLLGLWHAPPVAWNYPAVLILPLLDVATLQVIRHSYRDTTHAVRRLAGQLLTAQEQERQRLGRELHDGLAQDLTTIKLHLELGLARCRQGNPAGIADVLATAVTLADDAISELRDLLRDLRPLYLETLGLTEAVQTVTQRFTRVTGTPVDTQWEAGLALPLEGQTHLIRILQEALANVAKHAEASQVELRLERQPPGWRLSVRDDGRGFDPTQRSTGMGLVTLSERAFLLGGRLSIASRPGVGVAIELDLPPSTPNGISNELPCVGPDPRHPARRGS